MPQCRVLLPGHSDSVLQAYLFRKTGLQWIGVGIGVANRNSPHTTFY